MITIVEGDPDVGKSYLVTGIAVQITIGGKLPGGQRLEKGWVLYFSAEDDPAFTIRPRVDALGGDPSRIRFQANYNPFDDEGLETFRNEVEEYPPDLIIIDPLYAYIPSDSDVYRPNEIRAILAQISDIAESCGAAVVIIRHLIKGRRDRAIYQGAGIMDVIAVARSGLRVGIHPDDPKLRVIVHIKHNLSERGPSWMYELAKVPGTGVPILKWAGETDLTPEQLMSGAQDNSSVLAHAEDFLRKELASGPKPALKIKAAAEKRAISDRTLERAKKNVGVCSSKKGTEWIWSLET
jgi:hypothetical protein